MGRKRRTSNDARLPVETGPPGSRPSGSWAAGVLSGSAALALVMTACGGAGAGESASGAKTSTSSASSMAAAKATATGLASSSTGPGRKGLAVVYKAAGKGQQQQFSVLAGKGNYLRVSFTLYTGVVGTRPEEVLSYTWNGSKVLAYDSEGEPRYTQYEAPREDKNVWTSLEFVRWDLLQASNPGIACSRLTSARRVAGRPALGYRCRSAEHGKKWLTGDYWVDRDYQVLLSSPIAAAQKATIVPIDAATFSVRPPHGKDMNVLAAKTPPAGTARTVPKFTLKLLGGGTVDSTLFAAKPYVLAFFMSDLVFDTAGDSCPGCLASLLALQDLTHHGTSPVVLVVQVGDEGKPGYPLVPPGLTLRIANDPDTKLENSLGIAELIGYAFVDSHGNVIKTYDRAPTSQEFEGALKALG